MTDKAIRIPPTKEITVKDFDSRIFVNLGNYSLLFSTPEQMKMFHARLGELITGLENTRDENQVQFEAVLERTLKTQGETLKKMVHI